VWLPLALADLYGWLTGLFGKPVRRSDALASWSLPVLSAAVKRDEDESEDLETIDQFERLERMFGGN